MWVAQVLNDHPTGHFFVYELWESRELWQIHMKAKPLADFLAKTEGSVADITTHEMTRIA